MKLNKNYLLYTLPFIVLIAALFFLKSKNSNLTFKNSKLSNSLNSILKDSKCKSEIEGKYIWDISQFGKYKLDSLSAANSQNDFFLMLFIKKITCMKCYRFHVDYINNISDEIKVIGICDESHKMLKFDFPHSEIFNYTPFNLEKEFDFVIMFVTETGKIVYIDIADTMDYFQSENFYKKINNFLKPSIKNQ